MMTVRVLETQKHYLRCMNLANGKELFISFRGGFERLKSVIKPGFTLEVQLYLTTGESLNYRIDKLIKVVSFKKKEIKLKTSEVQGKKRLFTSMENIFHNKQELVGSQRNLFFFDLEMSLGNYHVKKEVKEIVQIGYVLTDPNGEIIKKYEYYINPDRFGLNKRTIKFLSLNKEKFQENCKSFNYFIDDIKSILSQYNPLFICWGPSDYLAIASNCQLKKSDLNIDMIDKVDLLSIYKNILKSDHDLGLFNTAKELFNFNEQQTHDGLIDAELLYLIYKKVILENEIQTISVKEELSWN
jgi:sporulation inhibitor KapD